MIQMIDSTVRTDLRVWLADLTYTGQDTQSLGADTFPLAIGCIATYTESRIQFTHPIRLFRYPEKVAQALRTEPPPDIMGFSNFVWNSELSLAFARRLKEVSPKTLIVMGGPNYPLEPEKQEAFLRRHREIDFYVLHEGEIAFAEMLKALIGSNMDHEKVKGTLGSVHSIDQSGKLIPAPYEAERIRDLDQVPSPYTTGKFDEFFDGRLWPLIQTKRGCPFQCTFCVEGIDYYDKIGRFSVNSVQTEIDYIGRKMAVVKARGGRNDLYIADSNFGMYKEDLDTCRALARSRALYGWPDHINTSTGKNKKERVLEAARIVDGRIVLSGSVQSLNEAVLDNIKRKNISADELMALAKEADNVDANSYCEVILGLPGETKESHFDTLRTTVTAGFNKVIPYQLMILGGSELGTDETINKYGMVLRSRVLPRAFGAYDVGGKRVVAADIEDICVATNTMSYEDYLSCRTMHLMITIFYNDIVFETVLKTIRSNDMPVFRWIELIEESVRGRDFESLFEDFRRHTDHELWHDRKELEAFIQQPGTIERYTRGELGFNLLYTFKALALVEHLDAVVDVVRVATSRLVQETLGRNQNMLDFFEAAIRWDACRISNIVRDLDREVSGTIAYDMARFVAEENPKRVSEYLYQRPATFRYELTDEQKDYVRRNLSIFGDNQPGIGRLLSNAHARKMLRTPVQVSAAQGLEKVAVP
jgi:radical SAM superfamily enzyme YgiQ (UPF0313 family)